MKLSMDTYLLRSRYGDKKAIEMFKEAGFDGIDYSFYWLGENERNVLDDNYVNYAHEVKSMLDANGMVCNQTHAPFTLTYTDELSVLNPKYRDVVRSMEFASILGAKCIVVHGIYVPEGEDFEALNIKYYKSLEPYCKKYEIKIAVENIFKFDKKRNNSIVGVFGRESDKLPEFIEKLNSPWFVACVDIGHASLTGKEPEDIIKDMKGLNILQALHVQDNDYQADRHILPYMGNLNWDNITKALAYVEYKGDISLEVFQFLKRCDDAFIPHALKYAAITGRYIIEKINSWR